MNGAIHLWQRISSLPTSSLALWVLTRRGMTESEPQKSLSQIPQSYQETVAEHVNEQKRSSISQKAINYNNLGSSLRTPIKVRNIEKTSHGTKVHILASSEWTANHSRKQLQRHLMTK